MEWRIYKRPIEYNQAILKMENRVNDIINFKSSELIWLLEHPSVYTAGTSARQTDLLDKNRFPVIKTNRGGQYTYHGPGQRIAYLMLQLKRTNYDIRKYIWLLEEWLIETLNDFSISGERRTKAVGIWVGGEKTLWGGSENSNGNKIASIGVRVRKGIAFHGISINNNPDLNHFDGIVSCGMQESGITSISNLGVDIDADQLDDSLIKNFHKVFEKF